MSNILYLTFFPTRHSQREGWLTTRKVKYDEVNACDGPRRQNYGLFSMWKCRVLMPRITGTALCTVGGGGVSLALLCHCPFLALCCNFTYPLAADGGAAKGLSNHTHQLINGKQASENTCRELH